jgi:hypothetical protein
MTAWFRPLERDGCRARKRGEYTIGRTVVDHEKQTPKLNRDGDIRSSDVAGLAFRRTGVGSRLETRTRRPAL